MNGCSGDSFSALRSSCSPSPSSTAACPAPWLVTLSAIPGSPLGRNRAKLLALKRAFDGGREQEADRSCCARREPAEGACARRERLAAGHFLPASRGSAGQSAGMVRPLPQGGLHD